MVNLSDSMINIEKFAAYLDGNLPASEMQAFSNEIMQSPDLQNLLEISDYIDESIECATDGSLDLPSELEDDLFYIPGFSEYSQVGGEFTENPYFGDFDPALPDVACASFMDADNLSDMNNDLSNYSLDDNSNELDLNNEDMDKGIDDSNPFPSPDDPFSNGSIL